MKLYWNPVSPNCRKVDAVAKQLGLALEYETLDLAKGDQRKPEFLALNPNGKVPVLVDGDVCLWESNAIANYIASKSDNSLWPKTNARYDIMRWQAWELAHFGSVARDLTRERMIKPMFRGQPADEAICRMAEEQFEIYAAVLDGHLAQNRYLVGGTLTTADFCVAAPLTYRVPAKLPLQGRKHVLQWLAALDEEPGWAGSAPPPM